VALSGTAIDSVIGVGWIVDEATTLFDPAIDGIPRNMGITGRFGYQLVRQVTYLIDGKGIGQCTPHAVNEKGRFSVQHCFTANSRLDAAPMRLYIDQPIGDGRGKPTSSIRSEWATGCGEAHIAVLGST
jgi:hypothetical protein